MCTMRPRLSGCTAGGTQKCRGGGSLHQVHQQGIKGRGAVRMGRDGELSILGRGNSLRQGVVAAADAEAHI